MEEFKILDSYIIRHQSTFTKRRLYETTCTNWRFNKFGIQKITSSEYLIYDIDKHAFHMSAPWGQLYNTMYTHIRFGS